MNAKKIITTVALSVFIITQLPIISFGQKGFYSTDSAMIVGIKIVGGGKITNAQWCQVKTKKGIERFSPKEVVRYGLNEGQVYISKKIPYAGSQKHFFLERLIKGEIALFYFADKKYSTFFIEIDSTAFFELPKGNKHDDSYFQKQLQQLTSDFPEIHDNAKLVGYNKKALTKFLDEYNKRIYKPFPHIKFGLVAFSELSKFTATNKEGNYLKQFDYKYDNSLGGGFFADIPISVSHLSFHIETLLSKHGYSFSSETIDGNLDFVANITSLKVPVMLRYTYPSKKISPFLNAGALISYNPKREAKIFETIISDNTITINDITTESTTSELQKGVCAGAGIEYRLNYKHSIFFELRYNQFFEGSFSNKLISNDLQLITSINF